MTDVRSWGLWSGGLDSAIFFREWTCSACPPVCELKHVAHSFTGLKDAAHGIWAKITNSSRYRFRIGRPRQAQKPRDVTFMIRQRNATDHSFFRHGWKQTTLTFACKKNLSEHCYAIPWRSLGCCLFNTSLSSRRGRIPLRRRMEPFQSSGWHKY